MNALTKFYICFAAVFAVIQGIFFILMLCDVIAWPWVWILAPTWVGIILIILWTILLCYVVANNS